MSLELAREVADAVLYEGYLLYPYRATSRKNQSRWQFGVLGPPGAAVDGFGEEPAMSAQCLLGDIEDDQAVEPTVTVHLRFLQLQLRSLEEAQPGAAGAPATFRPVPELIVDGQLMLSWDETVEHEVVLPTWPVLALATATTSPVRVEGGEDTELLLSADGTLVGRVVRGREPLHAEVRVVTTPVEGFLRLELGVENITPARTRTKDDAIRSSFIGAHLLIEAEGQSFVSLLEPPDEAVAAVASCQQRRCWPVLAGPSGSADVVLASPIILYDYPEIAPESPGALFDGCEIDEILTLRVMTMTESEKAEARATDPRAREIIERCDAMSVEDLQQLHGILRSPPSEMAAPGMADPEETPWFETGDVPWWDPAADERVQPEVDAVLIDGVSVSKGSLVRVHPSRRADAQDLFFSDQVARVTAVLTDVDGSVHVALVLVDDPASDLHDWYGRYLYFAPDELEPLAGDPPTRVPTISDEGKEGHP